MNIAITNELKISDITKHQISNPNYGKNYNEYWLSILIKCMNYFDFIKLEVILIKLYTHKLCKQKDFDYMVSLFS